MMALQFPELLALKEAGKSLQKSKKLFQATRVKLEFSLKI